MLTTTTGQIKCRETIGENIVCDLERQIGMWLESCCENGEEWPESLVIDIKAVNVGCIPGDLSGEVRGRRWFTELPHKSIEAVTYRCYSRPSPEDWFRVEYLICEVE